MKRIIKLFCVVSCLLVCFTGCGKKAESISYDAEQVRAYLETQISYVAGIIEEPANEYADESKSEEVKYITDNAVLKSAIESWSKLEEDCGNIVLEKSVSDFEISEKSHELVVTEVLKFDKRNVNVTATFEEVDETFALAGISFDPVYTIGEKMEQALMNTVMGMGTVFLVLIFISIVISLFKFIPVIIEKLESKKNKETIINTENQEGATVNEVASKEAVEDDTELISVIAAAIAASENTTTDSFVVRSIRKR